MPACMTTSTSNLRFHAFSRNSVTGCQSLRMLENQSRDSLDLEGWLNECVSRVFTLEKSGKTAGRFMIANKATSLKLLIFNVLALALGDPAIGWAQVATQSPLTPVAAVPIANRVTQSIDEKALVTLKGTLHPLARAANGMPLDRIRIALKRTDAQEAPLKQFIDDLDTPGTASYTNS